MFKRKKNVTEALKKQKFVISLPTEVWSEILRYFTRKQLCIKIHLVNRQLYDLVSSRHNVPTTHVIDIMSFEKANLLKKPTFFNIFKPRQYNGVCFRDGYHKTLETRQLREMPVPKPYVRFRKVYIFRLLGESTLKFLRDAKESFIGSAIRYFTTLILDNKDMRNQMDYLFQNVFHKPSYISFHGPCLEPKLEALTDGLLNCSKIKLQLRQPDDCNDDTIRMLLDWLSNSKSVKQNSQRDTGKKHLVLQSFPRIFILNLVQQIKDAFIDGTLLFSDFVITFSSSYGNRLCLEDDHTFILSAKPPDKRNPITNPPDNKVFFGTCFVNHTLGNDDSNILLFSDFVISFSSSNENRLCLEGDHKFIMNNISTNERLSLFIYNHFPDSDADFGLVYRLWCRRVVNEAEDGSSFAEFGKDFLIGN